MPVPQPITVAYGDGIGPSIMEAVLRILNEAGAQIEVEEIEIGEKLYLSGHPTGIGEESWKSIENNKVFLKAPITTPQGGGYKSLNVTIRTSFGLYANVRPCSSYSPFIHTKHPDMDVIVVRENEEDLYTGIEYRQTPDVVHATKLISRSGSERIIRFAFEYAEQMGRKKVSCFTKDNILKLSDGLFHQTFEEIGELYPSIEKEHWIVDIGSAKLADTPEAFDVLVLPNLYGDILSDVTAQISGSVGLAGSANIGDHIAMFEAIHGSAPRLAGQDLANPSGLLFGALMMLHHIGQNEVAASIHNAWLKTIEEGIHTKDIYRETVSRKKVGTTEFTQELIKRLGQEPETLHPVSSKTRPRHHTPPHMGDTSRSGKRELVGVDIYVYSEKTPNEVAELLKQAETPSLKLTMMTNRGVHVWPNGRPETLLVDQYRARFTNPAHSVSGELISSLTHRLSGLGVDVIKTENLYHFNDVPAYSHAPRRA